MGYLPVLVRQVPLEVSEDPSSGRFLFVSLAATEEVTGSGSGIWSGSGNLGGPGNSGSSGSGLGLGLSGSATCLSVNTASSLRDNSS